MFKNNHHGRLFQEWERAMETEFHSGPTKPGCEINGEENGSLFFCNACFVRESKHVYPSQYVCNYLIRKRSNSLFISLSHDKSKNPEMNHSFLIHIRFGGWHPLNEWYTLKAAGSRKVGFPCGKPWVLHVLHWATNKNRLLKSLDDCPNDWFTTQIMILKLWHVWSNESCIWCFNLNGHIRTNEANGSILKLFFACLFGWDSLKW